MTNVLSLLFLFSFGILIHASARGKSKKHESACPSLEIPNHMRVIAFPDDYFIAADPAAGTLNSGFLVDLLDAVQGLTGISYTLTARTDLGFVQNPNGSWDGTFIGTLINNEADLVGADLTVTSGRAEVVDMLMPFTTYDLNIVTNPQFGVDSQTQYVIQDDADFNYIKSVQSSQFQAIIANIVAGEPNSFVRTNEDGLAQVLTGNKAYIGDSPFQANAVAQSSGKLDLVPGSLGTFYLAMAVQQNSPLRVPLNVALLKLEETGVIRTLLTRYNLV